MLPILIQCAKHTPDYLLIQWSILYLEQKHLTFHLTWYKCRSEYPGHDTCIFTHAWRISIPSEKQKIKILEWISLTAQKDVAAKVIKWEFICFMISFFFFFFGSWMARQKDYSINTGFTAFCVLELWDSTGWSPPLPFCSTYWYEWIIYLFLPLIYSSLMYLILILKPRSGSQISETKLRTNQPIKHSNRVSKTPFESFICQFKPHIKIRLIHSDLFRSFKIIGR